MDPDLYADVMAAALEEFLQSGVAAGRERLADIAPGEMTAGRRSLTRAKRCEVFQRDGFRCQYCGRRVVLTPVMQLMSFVFGAEVFPFNAWFKTGEVHPAVVALAAAVDHREPVAFGGMNFDENLVTACNPCNLAKRNVGGWQPRKPTPDDDWDGLTRYYRPLWDAYAPHADEADRRYHLGWLRDLGR